MQGVRACTKLQSLIKDTATKGIDAIKGQLLAILDELLHKKGITKDEYTSLLGKYTKIIMCVEFFNVRFFLTIEALTILNNFY